MKAHEQEAVTCIPSCKASSSFFFAWSIWDPSSVLPLVHLRNAPTPHRHIGLESVPDMATVVVVWVSSPLPTHRLCGLDVERKESHVRVVSPGAGHGSGEVGSREGRCGNSRGAPIGFALRERTGVWEGGVFGHLRCGGTKLALGKCVNRLKEGEGKMRAGT